VRDGPAVTVAVAVLVGLGLSVRLGLGVPGGVRVVGGDGVRIGVGVRVAVAVLVAVGVLVGVSVLVGVLVAVTPAVGAVTSNGVEAPMPSRVTTPIWWTPGSMPNGTRRGTVTRPLGPISTPDTKGKAAPSHVSVAKRQPGKPSSVI
jgi:hypothetical protein